MCCVALAGLAEPQTDHHCHPWNGIEVQSLPIARNADTKLHADQRPTLCTTSTPTPSGADFALREVAAHNVAALVFNGAITLHRHEQERLACWVPAYLSW